MSLRQEQAAAIVAAHERATDGARCEVGAGTC
jgi:hypothetical protein